MKKGQRVEMTEVAIVQGFQGRAINTYGTVVGISEFNVRVLRDGLKTPDTYCQSFWKPLLWSYSATVREEMKI